MRLGAGFKKVLVVTAAVLLGAGGWLLGNCGPFTDVAADVFCPFVLEIFYLGITTGTTATTYDPSGNVTRLQMAAFLSRSVDGVLKRGSRRAAGEQFWTTGNETVLGVTTLPFGANLVKSDGADLWVANSSRATVTRVRASDGKILETWTGATSAFGVLSAIGSIFSTGRTNPGAVYRIDPSQPAGVVTTVASSVGVNTGGIAFDGARIWTANSNSVSIVTPGASTPWSVTTVTAGFAGPNGAIFDGGNIWVTDGDTIKKLDSSGAILLTVTSSATEPMFPAYDGSNIWVPNFIGGTVDVIRASSGARLATLTGNGLFGAISASFDGQRVVVTDQANGGVSLWKAADLSPIGFFSTGAGSNPYGAASDGLNFWLTLQGTNGVTSALARF
ncbi:MAG TPA: S-layer homology domain-containing protein [Thermoanaerobaculia bacterium]|nr:S-layer homology domain-containing protein [Thermoanaerobaculia bacterium]